MTVSWLCATLSEDTNIFAGVTAFAWVRALKTQGGIRMVLPTLALAIFAPVAFSKTFSFVVLVLRYSIWGTVTSS